MIKKNKIILILINLIVVLSLSDIYSQVKSIKAFSSYNYSLSNKDNIEKQDAVGGGLDIEIGVYGNLSVTLSGGYRLYSIRQENAQNIWGWKFWDARYSNTVRDNQLQNPNLSATVTPVQKMDVIPVILKINYEIQPTEDLFITPRLGGGFYFFSRRLFIEENWTKQFPDLDHTFQYSYRNFAPNKNGSPIVFDAGLDVEYIFADGFSITAGAAYNLVLDTDERFNYREFPFEKEFGINLGINFIY